nr:uncharacterized protein LOC104088389 [Nicotiana tomentosiformis]
MHSPFRVPVAAPGIMRQSTEPLLSSVDEHLITSAAFAAAASQPITPLASLPSTLLIPSSPATDTSPPPVTDTPEEDISPPQSPDHGNLGHNYSPLSANPQRRRSVSLSVSTECHLLSQPVELANYLKPLASEKDKKKIHSLSWECMINNAMHNTTAANFLAFEGLQKLILDKEKLMSERDQLLSKQDQVVAHLSELEAQVAKADELEARLQQSSNDVLAAAEREASSNERVINLEAALNSKTAEVATVEEKRAHMEDKYKRIIEHNRVHIEIIYDLDLSLSAARFERDSLSSEVDRLKSEL